MLVKVLQLRLKAVMTGQHTFLLKCIKFYSSFCKQSYDETTQACQKKLEKFNTEKKHLGWERTSSSRTGLTISSMLTSTTSFHQLPAGRPSSTFMVCDGVSGWQTIPGQWPWQTAACALLPAHSSIISSSQLVPLSFFSCCPGIGRDTQFSAGAPGLLRPEASSRVGENLES